MIRHVYSRCAPVAVFIRYSLNASGSRHRDVAVHKTDVEPHHGHLYEIKKTIILQLTEILMRRTTR